MEKAQRLYFVDYCKGISIIAIVLFHLISSFSYMPDFIKMASNFGGAGVHIFLICSGFGLYYSYLNKPITFTLFLKKRFSKIYIPYILVVIVSFCIPYMYYGSDRISALLSHIFLYKMFVPAYDESFGGQLWFVSAIIQFYLVFYLLIKMLKKLGNKNFFKICFLISLLWWIIIALLKVTDIRVFNSFFLQYLWEFAIGMIFAEEYRKTGTLKFMNIKYSVLIPITLGSIIIFSAMALSGGVLKVFNDIFSVLSFGGLILIIYRIKLFNKFFIWISSFSYEIYLLHILILEVCFNSLSIYIPNIIICIISLPIIIAVSYLYHKLLFNRR